MIRWGHFLEGIKIRGYVAISVDDTLVMTVLASKGS